MWDPLPCARSRATARARLHHATLSICLRAVSRTSSVWLCEAVSQANIGSGSRPPEGLRVHSSRGISSSTALHIGVSVQGFCTAAAWDSPCSFIRFYLRDVSSFPPRLSLSSEFCRSDDPDVLVSSLSCLLSQQQGLMFQPSAGCRDYVFLCSSARFRCSDSMVRKCA